MGNVNGAIQSAAMVKPAAPQVVARVTPPDGKAIVRPPRNAGEIRDLLGGAWFKQQLAAVLPKHLTPDRLAKVAIQAVLDTPKLMQCTQLSLLRSIIHMAELGLEPTGALGHAYLVPYKQTCQLIIGFKGLIELARRSGYILEVKAGVVYERDKLTWKEGLDSVFDVEPARGDRGEPQLWYSVAKFRDGGHHLEVMTRQEVEAIRSRSRAATSGPWVSDFTEMGKKTVVRRASKYWPMSPEEKELNPLVKAVQVDDDRVVDGQVLPSMPDALVDLVGAQAFEPESYDAQTGEVYEVAKALASETTVDAAIHSPAEAEAAPLVEGSDSAEAAIRADVLQVEQAVEEFDPADRATAKAISARVDGLPEPDRSKVKGRLMARLSEARRK